MAKLPGDRGRVFAFERDPSKFDLPQTNLRLNGARNVLANIRAVSDRADVGDLLSRLELLGATAFWLSEDAAGVAGDSSDGP
jgi:hypothetical protein